MMNSVINFLKEDFTHGGITYKVGVDFNTPDNRKMLMERLGQKEIDLLNHLKVSVIADYNEQGAGSAYALPYGDRFVVIYNLAAFSPEPEAAALQLIELTHHECEHIRQFQSGRLIMEDDWAIFDGVRYTVVPIADQYHYLLQPWETEAYQAGIKALIEIGHLDEDLDTVWASILQDLQPTAVVG